MDAFYCLPMYLKLKGGMTKRRLMVSFVLVWIFLNKQNKYKKVTLNLILSPSVLGHKPLFSPSKYYLRYVQQKETLC